MATDMLTALPCTCAIISPLLTYMNRLRTQQHELSEKIIPWSPYVHSLRHYLPFFFGLFISSRSSLVTLCFSWSFASSSSFFFCKDRAKTNIMEFASKLIPQPAVFFPIRVLTRDSSTVHHVVDSKFHHATPPWFSLLHNKEAQRRTSKPIRFLRTHFWKNHLRTNCNIGW